MRQAARSTLYQKNLTWSKIIREPDKTQEISESLFRGSRSLNGIRNLSAIKTGKKSIYYGKQQEMNVSAKKVIFEKSAKKSVNKENFRISKFSSQKMFEEKSPRATIKDFDYKKFGLNPNNVDLRSRFHIEIRPPIEEEPYNSRESRNFNIPRGSTANDIFRNETQSRNIEYAVSAKFNEMNKNLDSKFNQLFQMMNRPDNVVVRQSEVQKMNGTTLNWTTINPLFQAPGGNSPMIDVPRSLYAHNNVLSRIDNAIDLNKQLINQAYSYLSNRDYLVDTSSTDNMLLYMKLQKVQDQASVSQIVALLENEILIMLIDDSVGFAYYRYYDN